MDCYLSNWAEASLSCVPAETMPKMSTVPRCRSTKVTDISHITVDSVKVADGDCTQEEASKISLKDAYHQQGLDLIYLRWTYWKRGIFFGTDHFDFN